ncbi:MAG TPA: hypothetical protein VFQ57_00055 [Sphingomonas sp.]|jgi:hypothetical protein|nr:hypothetical protein [Sphingomonas sp.]
MAAIVDAREKLEDAAGAIDGGYAAWKRAKIERGLAQSQDRDALIPIEQLLRDPRFGG